MRFKDLVANSLPRVQGRKNKKTAYAHAQAHQEPPQEFSTCARYYPRHPVLDSRESSVERSSTVAVVDVPWRENAVYKSKGTRTNRTPDDFGVVSQPLVHYAPSQPPPLPLPLPRHGMVMSHSADGISSQATMALVMTSSRGYVNGSKVTTLSDHHHHYATTTAEDYQHYHPNQHHNMSAMSESAVNYIGPNCFYHSQYQQHQHHHHHHSHDHHYVYHHHHHRPQHHQTQTQIPKPTPLVEKSQLQVSNSSNTQETPPAESEKPRKSESGGFFRKSFASFRAMRKQGSRNKEQDARQTAPSDENEKCMVCPYPQTQGNDKNVSERKLLKQSRKGLKSLTKSKKKKDPSHENHHSDGSSWYSDSDVKKQHQNRVFDLDVTYTAPQKFPILECSMESSIPRHQNEGSREGSYVRELDNMHNLETASLSGYDSDVTKNRTGRSRSRIKTNPWLPSPQPSLTMGRRFENCQFRESHEDVMEEDNMSFFPRSASFDYHTQLGLSSFQTAASCGGDDSRRSIQRHRSLTPVDLKLNLSLPKPKPLDTTNSKVAPHRTEPHSKEQSTTENNNKNHLNDLNTKLTKSKSRPNSIVSPNSEFIALADNIEQLANNISFEYEDMFDASSLEHQRELLRENCNSKGGRNTMEENNAKRRKSESSPFSNDTISDNAHSPDSGIGCLGSCDGDDVMTSSLVLEQSPIITSPQAGISSQCSALDFNSTEKFNKTVSTPCHNSTINNDNKDTTLCSNGESQNLIFSAGKLYETSPSGRHSTRRHVSSSNESLNSAVISESDIDNTSYKYSENLMSSSQVVDSSKPLNSSGSLMVEERLDVNFRSLPRKSAGSRAKKYGTKEVCKSNTIGRVKNILMEDECSSSIVPLTENSLPKRNSETNCKLKNKHAAKQRKNDKRLMADKEHGEILGFKTGTFGCPPEENQAYHGLFLLNSESVSTDITTPLVVKLDGEKLCEAENGNDVTMKGHENSSQEMIAKGQMSRGFRNDETESVGTRRFTHMDTTVGKETLTSPGLDESPFDTVDACVQTDFYDFDSWERKQASPLPNLDDSFDPVESTRRWLLSGNMQGSADTGYSSQPRDSHVFMDEEAALLQFDALCDKSFQHRQHQNKGDSSTEKDRTSPMGGAESPLHFNYYFTNQIYDLPNHNLSQNDILWMPPTLNGLDHPGDGSCSNDPLNPPMRKHSVDNSDINKRHSSDSSTSTLTSDMPEQLELENIPIPECIATKEAHDQHVNDSFVAKKNNPEPDYVNLPSSSSGSHGNRHGANESHCSKHRVTTDKHGLLSFGNKNENQRKCTKCHCLHSAADSMHNNKLKTKCCVPSKEVQNGNMNSIRFPVNAPTSHHGDDRPDYLAFLKDAPLQDSFYRKNPVFIIPGFGPVEFSSDQFGTSANFDDFHPKNEAMGNVCVLNNGENSNRLNSHEGFTHSKNKYFSNDPCSRSRNIKVHKMKHEERESIPMALANDDNSVQSLHTNANRPVEKTKSGHTTSSGKRKLHISKDLRTERCPTMQSYDVDNFPLIKNGSNFSSSYPEQCPESQPPPLPDKLLSLSSVSPSANKDNNNTTRNLAERVSILRREKEIIYRKIQEVQQHELSRQREQLQQHRHLHSKRKEELLETLHDLKEKLEEQSKRLQMKCAEEI